MKRQLAMLNELKSKREAQTKKKKLSARKENRLKNKSNELLMTVLKIEKQIDTERRKKNQINGPLKS